jgi:c(7)-type cytochrome triheme protein
MIAARASHLRLGIVTMALLLMAGFVVAQNMPKLPADLTLPQTGDSPGKVVFSHQNHVGFQAKADCTACHPKLAPILKTKAAAKREALTHAKMEKGKACGACHNGKEAHGFDDCTTCHRS